MEQSDLTTRITTLLIILRRLRIVTWGLRPQENLNVMDFFDPVVEIFIANIFSAKRLGDGDA
jgi:hypothetical protein